MYVRFSRSVRLAALALLFLACTAGADEENKRPRDYRDRIFFDGGPAPLTHGCVRTYMFAATNKKGKRVAEATYGPYGVPGAVVTYPPDLQKNDLVPVLGEVYRISSISLEDRARMLLEKLPVDKRPRGIAPAKDSFTIPLRKDDQGHGTVGYEPDQQITVCVMDIVAPAKEGEKATARLTVSLKYEGTHASEATVKQGDVILFGKHGVTVRAIVPADAKTRIIGWVEFGPEAIPEKDLVAKKIPFVRPTKRDK